MSPRGGRSTRIAEIGVNSGHDRADVLSAADPDGRPVTQIRVATQTPLDTYLRRKRITLAEWNVGDRYLRLCHFAAMGPRIAQVNWSAPVGRNRVLPEGISERQESARSWLRGAHGYVGPTFADVLFHVIVERSSAADWARKKGYRETSGIDFFRDALCVLGEHWGMGLRRNQKDIRNNI